MGRGSAYSDPNNSLEPLTAIVKPYVTSRGWINYLRDPASKADKKRLAPCLPIAKDLQKLHPGLSFRYSTFAQVLKGINQLPEFGFIPEDQEEQVCEIHAMMLLTVCRHASKGPLRRPRDRTPKGPPTKTGEDEVEDKDDEEDGEEDQDEEEEGEDEDEDEDEHEDEAEKKVVANEKVMAHLAPPCDRFTAFSKRCTTMVDSDDEIDMDESDMDVPEQEAVTVKEEVEEKEEAPAANVTNAQAVDIDKEVNKQEDKKDKNWRLDIEVKRLVKAPVPAANLNIALAQGQKGDGNEVKLEYEYGWNVDLRQAWRLPLNGPVPKNRSAKEFVKPTFDPKSNKLDHPMAMFPTGDPWLIPNITVEDCLAWGKERAKPRVKSVGQEKDEEEEEAAPDEGAKRKARSDETNDEEAASVKGGKRKAKDEEIAPVKGSRRKAQDDETDGSKRLKKDN